MRIAPESCAIRKVGRDQADEKRSNGNLTPGQVDWKGRSVDVDRSQGRANESTDPVAPSRIGDFAVPSETTKQPSQGNEDQRSRKLVNAGRVNLWRPLSVRSSSSYYTSGEHESYSAGRHMGVLAVFR